ncbi:hypothetical protein L2E82_25361 [Cichorium intybus]|uniref:Uncharacterized protein n=1 Tax=Cichorium intybus TaxID=13427 RepID=A0ACB9E4E4_CICIN|nr:hypothetical protein L2E82_25361 [Cichorium intybus]
MALVRTRSQHTFHHGRHPQPPQFITSTPPTPLLPVTADYRSNSNTDPPNSHHRSNTGSVHLDLPHNEMYDMTGS